MNILPLIAFLAGRISRVTLLGHTEELKFSRTAEGWRVELPATLAGMAAGRPFALRIVAAPR